MKKEVISVPDFGTYILGFRKVGFLLDTVFDYLIVQTKISKSLSRTISTNCLV